MSTTSDTSPVCTILTIDQAAAYLSIPKATLYTWRTRRVGYGPRAVKMGGNLRYRLADLDAWIEEHAENFTDDDGGLPVPAPRDGSSLSRRSHPR
ncbi:helix-turn-helix transcriptional regulator [Nocardioides daphniae]|uniref:DNA-binding protein n=1 Tax=Nocardioides daphniae TaxID=402297 RepID=A0A4P7UAQ0_9ACTN|nr:helix-turn-helix domain-containing protein [Nocardioides daphniae]QCC77182.1 DNA-binding protein [Nocardioides daphniae]GGD27072.1 hypothetical protein GCM10007231_28130 [Nocardioides daphniae]